MEDGRGRDIEGWSEVMEDSHDMCNCWFLQSTSLHMPLLIPQMKYLFFLELPFILHTFHHRRRKVL